MKNLLLATSALMLIAFSAEAHDNVNLNIGIPLPGVIIAPAVVIPIDQCTMQYNAIVQQEQFQLQNCNISYQYDANSAYACQQNVMMNTNAELGANQVCLPFYVQNQLYVHIDPRSHGVFLPHRRFEQQQQHHENDHRDNNHYNNNH